MTDTTAPRTAAAEPEYPTRPAEGQETIVMMRRDNYRAQLRQMVEQGRARNDPTLAISLSLDTVANLLDAAEAIEPLLALVRAALKLDEGESWTESGFPAALEALPADILARSCHEGGGGVSTEPHQHSVWECGVMVHVGSRHWMDELCSLPEGADGRCRFMPYRHTRLDLKPRAAAPHEDSESRHEGGVEG